jgi:hypothetical protein
MLPRYIFTYICLIYFIYWAIRYGGRVPTHRNVPGQRAEPVRYYPAGSTPRVETSAVLLQSAPNAEHRNMQNIQKLSSGAYGSFSKTRTIAGPAPGSGVSLSQLTSPIQSHRSEPQTSARRVLRTEDGAVSAGRSSARKHAAAHSSETKTSVFGASSNPEPYAQMTQRTRMKTMLNDLDSTFSRRNKYDLSTVVSGPPTDIGHLKMYGIANYKNYEEGGPWSRALRRSGTSTARK